MKDSIANLKGSKYVRHPSEVPPFAQGIYTLPPVLLMWHVALLVPYVLVHLPSTTLILWMKEENK